MEYDNTNSGVLFKNTRKETEKHPDYTGSINIEGTDRWLSAWVKEGKSGKFFSLSIGKVKEQLPPASAPAPVDESFDDDIPF